MKEYIINFLYFLLKTIERIEYRKLDLDENDISKKIIGEYEVGDYQVTSDTGLVDISHVCITQPYTHYILELDNGLKLTCADNHIVFDKNLKEVFVKDLTNEHYIQTEIGISRVLSVNKLNRKTSMGDLSIDHENHRYYTNGILSHNTIVASIYILHYMLFNNTKNVLLAANVLDTSKEVLDKIKNIYGYLPFFLQQGIDVWNVSQIKFENGCRAKAFAMTKNASIGNTGDLVYVDEFAHINDSIADKFYKSIFPTLTSVENSKMIITSTPSGFNLFHKLITESELEPTDPKKNSFGSLRVYWHQVPGRNVTYFKLNPYLLPEYSITIDMILDQSIEMYNPNDEVTSNKIPIVELKYDPNNGQPWIHIQNTEDLKYEDLLKTEFVNRDGEKVHVSSISTVSTWKMDTTKNIGGDDNFNQEYDLRFSAGSKNVLSEETIERLSSLKLPFEHIHDIDMFKKLRWDWSALKFVEGYNEDTRKNTYNIISIDISEGLGQDYSVINLFKVGYKSQELIKKQKERLQTIQDFFQADQFGVFRSNVVSHSQLAEIAYLLIYEFLDPEKTKVVVEYNNDGKAFLSELKNVFERDNDYYGFPILNFKHRLDSTEKSKGLKVGQLKNKYVKDYQDRMERQEFIIHHEVNIREVGTFTKHITPAGNVVYKGDGSNDDLAMTLVNMSQGWNNSSFKEMILEYHDKGEDSVMKKLVDDIISGDTKSIGTDYGSFFKGKDTANTSVRTNIGFSPKDLF